MSVQSPPTLLELAGRSLLSDNSRSILYLEDLPIELFPPLFVEAFSRGHTEILKKMVQAWPFTRLPLGALMRKPQLEMIQVALEGLDMLLAQQDHPRHLKTPLETLSITNCPLSDSDWKYLSRYPNTRQLRNLELRGIKLTDFSLEPLQILLDNTSTTLNSLDLAACGITDYQLQALSPALSRCSKLVILSIHGNRLSMSALSDLLLHTARLSQLSVELYPAPLESYDAWGTIHPGRCSQLCAELTAIVRDFRQPNILVFCTVPCRHCGSKFMYNQGLIHCSCPIAA
ncbi:PRAME family member 12-like [Ictidomys tridecemlineatus]